MISICLKTNNLHSLNYIEQQLNQTTISQIFYSQKKFKIYNNIIIHYLGDMPNEFYNVFSDILSNLIIANYEKTFIKQQLQFDFFYFSLEEKKQIQQSTLDNLNTQINQKQKQTILHNCIQDYFLENSTCILDGFINFRLYNYKNFIDLILENTINDYVIKKEYAEYVNLLSEYISIQEPQTDCIHLIYGTNLKLLLDNNKNVITDTTNSTVYLSDISFSSNDFILNSLLSLLPHKLYIHLSDNIEDNFIQFLKLIFKGKFVICNNCNICNLYFSQKNIINNNKQ